MTSVLMQLINEWTRPIVVVQDRHMTEVQGQGHLYNDMPVVRAYRWTATQSWRPGSTHIYLGNLIPCLHLHN